MRYLKAGAAESDVTHEFVLFTLSLIQPLLLFLHDTLFPIMYSVARVTCPATSGFQSPVSIATVDEVGQCRAMGCHSAQDQLVIG